MGALSPSATEPPPTEVGGFCACRLKPTGAALTILYDRALDSQVGLAPAAAPSCVKIAHAVPQLLSILRHNFRLRHSGLLLFLPTAQCAASPLKPSPKGEGFSPRQVTKRPGDVCLGTAATGALSLQSSAHAQLEPRGHQCYQGTRRRLGDGPLGQCASTAASLTTVAEGWR